MIIWSLFFILAFCALLLCVYLLWLTVLRIQSFLVFLLITYRPQALLPSECQYHSINLKEPMELPEISSPAEVHLSVVIPAYNERNRLPLMLKETLNFLSTYPRSWEILIVDDGSTDDTFSTAVSLSSENIRVIKLVNNRGKGGCVRHGIEHSRGQYILFADADGASRFDDLEKLLERINENGIAIGSRAHMVNTDSVVKRSFIRNLLMYSFHSFVRLIGIKNIKDTQCGFKLFTRAAAEQLFPNMHVEGWVFDVEILLLAEMMGIPVQEVPISWKEVQGSRLNVARDSAVMGMDLICIRIAYTLGIWKVQQKTL
ncbi:Dolichyl-phosphate beta-glucosyltransferase [Neolecta irregularis DAH-3]|uniref:dolichyl-phosphate beta-glucosyltransferase n=1 Tax=Neolecta irregularis (strain DAH-3) TaxID=1198029 RepID=A0A1U7LQD1_NEOID|nr:Dolichyl-phosphate beta-glucosyltransferase [Neolecta irregularis DAH-3]|eukprot:OLL24839.1 Dolichyl-phosphate beta-glucosyltransferase [Neolecta irregularis DAH-3]